jgi:hypothetical protein
MSDFTIEYYLLRLWMSTPFHFVSLNVSNQYRIVVFLARLCPVWSWSLDNEEILAD